MMPQFILPWSFSLIDYNYTKEK
jgi:hypothetical protein